MCVIQICTIESKVIGAVCWEQYSDGTVVVKSINQEHISQHTIGLTTVQRECLYLINRHNVLLFSVVYTDIPICEKT